MKILLLGEYSNVHWTLAEGLRHLGHEVTVVSNGDFWKDYPRDISLVRSEGKLGGISYLTKVLTVLPRLRGYDIVQLINPMFLELKAERITWFYDFIRRNNRKVVLASYGMDYYWVNINSTKKPLRYSDFNVGDRTRTDEQARIFQHEWSEHTAKAKLNKKIAHDCDFIVAGLQEYDVTYRAAGFGKKMAFVPYPINVSKLQTRNEIQGKGLQTKTENQEKGKEDSAPINIFIGISKNRSSYKGTDIMLAAAKRIAKEYPDKVRLTIAEGVPFAEYTKMLHKADVLLDQLYSYTPAMNALEAMARGTIVVGGGEPENYEILGEEELRPIINVLPTEESVFCQLESLVLNPDRVPILKQQSIDYIKKHHDYRKVAAQYAEIYNKLAK